MKTRALLLALLVLLAGCGGSVQETETTGVSTTAQAPTTTEETTTTAQTTDEPTTVPTTVEDTPDNPWEKENVTVTIWGSYNQSRDLAPLVNKSLAYWNENASKYGDYNVTFILKPNTRGADIVVDLVPRIPECGHDGGGDSTVGCASVLKSYSTPDRPEKVRVVGGYSNESTVKILNHEFGHIMGVEHGEEPMPLMEPISQHTYLSQPDLADRALPWQNSTLSVYVDTENVTSHDQDEVDEQIGHALSYYEEGADGNVPENVSFTRTDNWSAADIRISIPDDYIECAGSPLREGSCGKSWVYDTDTDDAYEYFSDYSIYVRGIDEDAVGWHVGYWLSDAFGLAEDEVPEAFVDADYDDRRSDWWE